VEDYTEAPSALSSHVVPTSVPPRPTRADAARNYDALIAAARDAFTEDGADASLEGIARRAGVGIGTLYRNFPTRQALLEAVYVEEVDAICRAAGDHDGLDPWDALTTWLRSFVDYAKTKKALAGELLSYMDDEASVFTLCRQSIVMAAIPLFEAAQRAGAVRDDVEPMDAVRMVGGIATIPNADPGQIDRILTVALDGLRPR
jgi:AcrR family transcriptional regulator